MLRGRALEVDNSDPRARLQGGREIVEEGIGLAYLVIHVHEDCGIERGSGPARVVRFAQRESDVGQLQAFRSPGELDEVIPRDVLGDNRAGGTDKARETNRVVAAACTNVADRHVGLQFKKTGDLAGLIQRIAVLLGSAARADDLCNRARRGEGNSFAGIPGGAR
jgi:hypothetical protein